MKRLASTLLILLVLTLSVAPVLVPKKISAAQNTFQIGVSVLGIDIIAPTVPTGFSATTFSNSRIDLSWNPSTDNVGVAGYKVFRDLVFLATTTQTNYSDTGLSPQTSYSYSVSAFDASGNESAQSTSSIAITHADPVVGQTGGSSSGAVVGVVSDLIITPGLNDVTLSWKTNMNSYTKVFWGKGADYELGVLSEVSPSNLHSVNITNLEPGTDYLVRFEITYVNKSKGAVGGIHVRTLTAPDTQGTANVTQFEARQKEKGIGLSWKNPTDSDFKFVRIVKSEKFFPVDPLDGVIVYEGKGENAIDEKVKNGGVYYYTAFTKDTSGNWSSGAVASAGYSTSGTPVSVGNPLDNLTQAPSVDPRIKSLRFEDFKFIQNGKILSFLDASRLLVDGAKNLMIALDYDRVPEILKTIAITLALPDDSTKHFSFLLHVNKEKTQYEASIAPLLSEGEYSINIAVIDYKNRGLIRLNGSMLATVEAAVEILPNAFSINSTASLILLGLIVKLITLLALLYKSIRVILRALRVHKLAVTNALK